MASQRDGDDGNGAGGARRGGLAYLLARAHRRRAQRNPGNPGVPRGRK
jgi:hypothetical protein